MDIFPIRRPPDVTPETLVPDLSDGAEAGLYLALFELVEEGLIITSDETILEVNSAACHLLERSYPDLVGQPLAELFPTEAAFLAARGALFVEGASRGSLLLRMPGGERRHLRCLSAARVRPGVHALVLSPDTAGLTEPTPPRPIGDKVWPRLAAAVRQPVLVVDAGGRIRAANATAQARLGSGDTTLLGRMIGELELDPAGLRRLPGPQVGWEVVIVARDVGGAAVLSHPADGRHRRAFEALPMPALLCAADTLRVLDANRAALDAYGRTRGQLIGNRLDTLRQEGEGCEGRQRHLRADGSSFPVDLFAERIETPAGGIELLLVHQPIEEPTPVQQFGGELFALTADGVLIVDQALRILAVNPALCALAGSDKQGLLGAPAAKLLADGTEDPFEGFAKGSARSFQGEVAVRNEAGKVFPAVLQIARVGRGAEQIPHYLATLRDLGEREALRAEARAADAVDQLTGLPDRGGLAGPFMDLASRARHARRKLVLIVVDVDGFHRINAQLGEEQADRLLARIGERLVMNAPEESAVARIGPDSFVILAGGHSEACQARELAEDLLDVIGAPLQAGALTLSVAASAGVAIGPEHGEDLAGLLSAAEESLHLARSSGRPVHVFDAAERVDSLARVSLDAAIRRAPDRGELTLHWQPRYSLAEARLVGAEALLRWQHPQLGMLDAEQFVPAAIRSGSIDALGRWALARACEQAAAWHDAYNCELVVSINVSARELSRPEFADELRGWIGQYALRAELLELELGHCGELPRNGTAMSNLYVLQETGVRLRMDRFGADGAPLSALRHLPLSGLKIDPQFVRDLILCDEGQVLIEGIMHTARGLGLDVVAAGVEHAEQRDLLAKLGCSASQGRLQGAPISSEAFGRLLARAFRRGG